MTSSNLGLIIHLHEELILQICMWYLYLVFYMTACSTSRNTGTRNTGTPEHHGTLRNTRKTRNTPQKPGTLPRKPGTPQENPENRKKTGKVQNHYGSWQNLKELKGREISRMHAKMKRTRR